MDDCCSTRRKALLAAGLLAAGALPLGVRAGEAEPEVTATEDLMREHGVIRRVLLVYADAARRLRRAGGTLPTPALLDAGRLFRRFAEDYHERALEEAHIFPVVRKLRSPAGKLPDVLKSQHDRGREITDYLLRSAAGPSIAPAAAGPLAGPLAGALEALVAMYEPHAAREDTQLFPAWKAALGTHAYAEAAEQFEEIEHRTFGGDGFDDALERVERIEREFGLADLSTVTAPAPPPR